MVSYILALSILVQFSVAVVAILLARRQTNVYWYLISLAMFLAGVRRCVTLYSGIQLGQNVEVSAEAVALAISMLALIGVVGIFRASSRLPENRDAFGWLEKANTMRRLTRTGFLLGAATVTASVVVGYASFIAGRQAAYQRTFDSNLSLARMLATAADGQSRDLPAEESNSQLSAIASEMNVGHGERYLCVIDRSGRLIVHSLHPERVGSDVGQMPIDSDTYETINELALSEEDWVGFYATKGGERQIAAAAYSTALDALLMVHEPRASIDATYRRQALPWSIGLAVLILFLFPLSLGFLRSAFISALRSLSEATRALRQSEERYRLLADNVSDVIFAIDTDLSFTYISPSVEQLTGHSTEDVRNITIQSTVTPDSFERIQKLVEDEMKAEKEGADPDRSVMLELEVLRTDGTIIPVETRVAYTRDSEGNPSGIVGVSRDISERVEAEKHRQNLEEQLRHSEKMKAVGTLAGGIAHDFNNILHAILGFSEMAREAETDEEHLEQCLEEISAGAVRGAELVRQILAFSSATESKYIPVDVREPLQESLKLLRGSLPSTIEIRTQVSTVVSPVYGDATQIHQIIMNLCTNAYQAMQDNGGVLEITLKDTSISGEKASTDSNLNEGNYVVLRVRDFGCGISPDILGRIFDPFFTTKEVGKGTGLGLSVIHGIVDNMGGTICVQSVVGEGTTFEVYWPAIEKETFLPKVDKPKANDGQTLRKERILFVDDEASIVKFVRLAFEKKGFQIEAYTRSAEALSAFRAHRDEFDIVVTDLTMPEMSGKELADEIHMLNKSVPILLCTGMEEYNKNPTELERVGIVECLHKPLVVDDLCEAIARHCGERRAGSETVNGAS